MTPRDTIEEMIQARRRTAPRITPAAIEGLIAAETYQRVPETTVTVCVLTLRNGYAVIGHSACVSPSNYDEEIGQRVAREDAVRQIWPLAGYALAEQIHQDVVSHVMNREGALLPGDFGE